MLYIKFEEPLEIGATMKVYSLDGKLMETLSFSPIHNRSHGLDVSNYMVGTYILEFNLNGTIYSKKFVVIQ